MKYWALLSFMFLASAAFALPSLFDSLPVDNSFTGKGSVVFRVNITSPDLDTNNVELFVISEDAYNNQEPWERFVLSCSNEGNWVCSRNVSFSIAGSDTQEYFYFQANDSSGQNRLGSASNPMRFKIDRTAPLLTFVRPANNSYVAGDLVLEISVSDGVSGVNESLLRYSVDGIVWNNFQENIGYINTLMYANNEHLTIMANATDNAGNSGISTVKVIVDNENPQIMVIAPVQGNVLKDSAAFSLTTSDQYSGINASDVSFSVGGLDADMLCSGTPTLSCTYDFDTLLLPDGPYSLVFSVHDSVGNSNSSAVSVTIKNSKPRLTLTPEGYVKGILQITADITNPEGTISGVNLEIKGHGNASMACNTGFTRCTYQMNTSVYGDVGLELNASASNILGHDISDTAVLNIDNTQPYVTIEMVSVVKGPADITARVTDNNSNPNAVVFSFLGNGYEMSCYQGAPMVCYLNYGFETAIDGRYNISVRSYDYAENLFIAYKEIAVDKNPPEMLSLSIEPLNPSFSTGVIITADMDDKGSDTKWAYVVIKHGSTETRLDLVDSGNWSEKFYAQVAGAYSVSMYTEDMNSNAANFTDIGYFFMGQLVSCGNGACDGGENYCLCPSDCQRPSCFSGSPVCSSGVPVCSGPLRCGDRFCSVTENCSTCPQDCGICQPHNQTVSDNINDVEDAADEVYGFAMDYTPIFTTLVAIAILSVIVILVLRKKFSR